MNTRIMNIQFLDYWQAGTGQAAGGIVDSVAQRSTEGLPFLPGRHLKGLLRQSIASAEQWGWFADQALPEDASVTDWLFGSDSRSNNDSLAERSKVLPGLLRVGNAQLSEAERQWFQSEEGKGHVSHLYQELYSTSISLQTGAAKRHSLRGMEVVIPVALRAEISLRPQLVHPAVALQEEWIESGQAWDALQQASALIDHLGGNRNRGLGRALISWQPTRRGASI